MTEKELEDFVEMMLETESFEDLLERFNVTPTEVFTHLYYEGLVDINLVHEMMSIDLTPLDYDDD